MKALVVDDAEKKKHGTPLARRLSKLAHSSPVSSALTSPDMPEADEEGFSGSRLNDDIFLVLERDGCTAKDVSAFLSQAGDAFASTGRAIVD